MVEGWVVRLAKGVAESIWDSKGSGWLDLLVMPRTKVIETVEIPAASIARWISPTDWLHSGQTGVRKATSTPSDLRCCPTSGAVRLIKRPGAV